MNCLRSAVEEPQVRATPGRISQVDGLRGLAMLLVFLGHFGAMWSASVQPDGPIAYYLRIVDADASMGTNLFMLLSAFFSYGSLRRGGRAFGAFLRGRFGRIYPLYLVVNGVYIIGCVLVPEMSKLPGSALETVLFLLQTVLILPGLLPIRPLMDVAWTLSFIVFFYFVAGAQSALFRHLETSRKARILVLVLAASVWAVAGYRTGWWEPRTSIFWTGMALSEVVEAMCGERRGLAGHLAQFAVPVVFLGVAFRTYLILERPGTPILPLILWRTLTTGCTLAALLWVCYFGAERWTRILSLPELRRLGITSYSYYLTHGFAVKAFRFGVIPFLGTAADSAVAFWACQLAGLGLSIWIAQLAFDYLEKPLTRLAIPETALAGR